MEAKLLKLKNIKSFKKSLILKLEQKLIKTLGKTDVTLQIPDCSKFIKHCNWEPKENFEKV